MFALFRALSERIKTMFITDVALDFEADLLARDAARRAELLRQADRYQAEGLDGIAEHLRHQTEALSLQRPLAGVLPAAEHLIGRNGTNNTLFPQTLPSAESPAMLPAITKPKKKGR